MASTNQLLNKYTFWFFDNSVKEEKPIESADSKQVTEAFNEKLKPIVTFSTINQFWEIFQYMKKPKTFDDETDIYLFREGIKPLWEDPNNQPGGYFTIKLEKQQSNKVWENIVLAFVAPIKGVMECVNGIRIKAKEDLITLQIWMNGFASDQMNELKPHLKQCLQITDDKVFAYFGFSYHLKKVKKEPFSFKPQERQTRQKQYKEKGGGRQKRNSFFQKKK